MPGFHTSTIPRVHMVYLEKYLKAVEVPKGHISARRKVDSVSRVGPGQL